jgi:hypothetical protein
MLASLSDYPNTYDMVTPIDGQQHTGASCQKSASCESLHLQPWEIFICREVISDGQCQIIGRRKAYTPHVSVGRIRGRLGSHFLHSLSISAVIVDCLVVSMVICVVENMVCTYEGQLPAIATTLLDTLKESQCTTMPGHHSHRGAFSGNHINSPQPWSRRASITAWSFTHIQLRTPTMHTNH